MGCSPDSLLLPLKTHVEISHRTCACRPIKFNNLIRSKFSCFTPKHKFMVKNYCGALLPSYRRVLFPNSLSWGCVYSPTYWSLPPPPSPPHPQPPPHLSRFHPERPSGLSQFANRDPLWSTSFQMSSLLEGRIWTSCAHRRAQQQHFVPFWGAAGDHI